jgi:RND superfamily putative drug exporter
MYRSTNKPRNLAASMGRWSAAHWKTATFGWLALVVVAFAIGAKVGTKSIDPSHTGPGQSGRMDRILDAGFKQPAPENVLIQSRTARAHTPAFDAAVADVVTRVSQEPVVIDVRSPLAPGHADQISRDGRSALVEFDIRGDKNKAADKIGPVVDAVAAAQAAHPGFFIGEMGDASAQKAVKDANLADLGKAGMLSLPITLAILTSRSVRSSPQAFRCCSRSPPSSRRSAWSRSPVTCSRWRRRCRRSCS